MIKIAASCLLLAGVVLSQYTYLPPPTPPGLYSVPSSTPRKPPTTTLPGLYSVPSTTPRKPPTTTPPSRYTPPNNRPPTPTEGMPYDFQYGVQDPESGNTYSHVENSDGKTMQGEYRVLLPDGRTQVVNFYDNGGGFNADVTYI